MKSYYIDYDFGIHRHWIETTESDFFKVIDDMSTEFTIYKEESFEEDKNWKRIKTEYDIINYMGDKQTIGVTFEHKWIDYIT